MRLLPLTSALALAAASLALSGCAGMSSPVASPPVTVTAAKMTGTVFGGRQPIANASLTLYDTGTTGYGQGATAIGTTSTDKNGMFAFTGATCVSGTQVYIVSNGGDPFGNGENNTDATLISGLTSCDNLASVPSVWISEVTTVSTVWALAPFMNGVNIGAPASNQAGLAAAFADINTLVNVTNGTSPGPNLPAGTTVPTSEINTLADALASCVNSDISSGPSTTCSDLFTAATPPSGTAPGDTVSAALNIARYPGNNVAAIIAAGGKIEPYQPTIAMANDLTIGVTYTTSSIINPTALAVDAGGNVWIASTGIPAVTELSHSGSVEAMYRGGSLDAPSAIAIDLSGNAWIANKGNSTLSELDASGLPDPNSPYSGNGLSSPTGIAFDGFGNIWVSNSNNSVSQFTSAGGNIGNYTPTGLNAPVGIALNPH